MKYRVIPRKLVACSILALVAFLVPLFLRNLYHLHIAITALIAAICALGLRLILCTGHLSLGQAVFLAAGAYSSVSLVCRLGLSFWLALPLAGLFAAAFAALIGWPALRLKGAYFALLTFGLGEAVRLALINGSELTGGPAGIPGGETSIRVIPPPNTIVIMGFSCVEFTSKASYYYLSLVLFIITAVVMERINVSRMGSILKSIEQSDSLAESVGIDVAKYRLLAFTIACFFAGLAGAFYAHYLRSITPEDFNFWKSADIVIYAIIGGRANIFGPIIGAVVLVALSNSIAFLARYQTIVYGAIGILVVMFLPGGLLSLPGLILNRFRRGQSIRDLEHE